jgi:hypothetical protein
MIIIYWIYWRNNAGWVICIESSSLPPVVSTRTHVLFTFLGVCLRIVVSNTYCVVFFVCLFLSTSCVLYTQCCQVLWIIHSWFPFRFFLMLLMRMAEALFSVAVQEQLMVEVCHFGCHLVNCFLLFMLFHLCLSDLLFLQLISCFTCVVYREHIVLSSWHFIFVTYYGVLNLCQHFEISFPCCDVHIKTILSSSLPPVVSTRTHVLFTFIGVCLRIVVSNTYCVVFFVCLFLSTSRVLYTQCCQVLWIIHSWFPFHTTEAVGLWQVNYL